MNFKSRLSFFFENFLQNFKKILRNIEDDHISESSAQCAYYIMLSFVPFLILFITLLQYTHISSDQLFNIISELLPSTMNGFVLGIVKEIYSKSLGTISISLIFTLYAAAKGLYALIKGLHKVYNYSDNRKRSFIYLRFVSLIKTLVFILMIMFGLVIMVFGRTIIETMQNNFGMFENYTVISEIIIRLIIIFFLFIVYLIIYKFLPGHKITFRSQIWGALFASISLNIISLLASYINVFSYSITYGSLTALFTIMIWIYFVFYISFLGAEINKFINLKKKENYHRNFK